MNAKEKEYIPLSQINTFVYCPRRFYYEFVEGEMRVNEHVEEGKIKHRRVDQPMQDRSERDKLVSRRQYLASEKLGVSGFSDVIEEQDGILYPVEYKKGKTGNWLNDKVQLCLEAMLLEEATGKSVPHGYIYYIGSNRRRKVDFDDELRHASLEAVKKAYRVSRSDRIVALKRIPLMGLKLGQSLQRVQRPIYLSSRRNRIPKRFG